MIWVLLGMFFLVGETSGSGGMLTSAGVKQLIARTEVVIEDPGREEAALETLDKLQEEVKAFEKIFSKSGKQLIKSYKDHAFNIDQEHMIHVDLNSSWQFSQQSALDLRFELKESMTEEEWTVLFSKTSEPEA